MNPQELIKLVQSIVQQASQLKNQHTTEHDACVNYACIFSQNLEEQNQFIAAAHQIGKVIQETPSGPLFQITPMMTISGSLQLLKIRKPDPTRPERGDADFTVSDYTSFKNKYLAEPGFSLIERKDFEMIELIDSNYNVRTYFSHPPLDQQLGLFH
jgi:hypothetical protein